RHRGLLRPAGQPPGRLRPAQPVVEDRRRRRLLADLGRPAVPARGHLPVPDERPPARLGGRAAAAPPLRGSAAPPEGPRRPPTCTVARGPGAGAYLSVEGPKIRGDV